MPSSPFDTATLLLFYPDLTEPPEHLDQVWVYHRNMVKHFLWALITLEQGVEEPTPLAIHALSPSAYQNFQMARALWVVWQEQDKAQREAILAVLREWRKDPEAPEEIPKPTNPPEPPTRTLFPSLAACVRDLISCREDKFSTELVEALSPEERLSLLRALSGVTFSKEEIEVIRMWMSRGLQDAGGLLGAALHLSLTTRGIDTKKFLEKFGVESPWEPK